MRVALMQKYGAESTQRPARVKNCPRHNILCDGQDRHRCPIIAS